LKPKQIVGSKQLSPTFLNYTFRSITNVKKKTSLRISVCAAMHHFEGEPSEQILVVARAEIC